MVSGLPTPWSGGWIGLLGGGVPRLPDRSTSTGTRPSVRLPLRSPATPSGAFTGTVLCAAKPLSGHVHRVGSSTHRWDGFAAVGPRCLRARRARKWQESRLGPLIEEMRYAGVPSGQATVVQTARRPPGRRRRAAWSAYGGRGVAECGPRDGRRQLGSPSRLRRCIAGRTITTRSRRTRASPGPSPRKPAAAFHGFAHWTWPEAVPGFLSLIVSAEYSTASASDDGAVFAVRRSSG